MIELGVEAIKGIANWFTKDKEVKAIEASQRVELAKAQHELEIAKLNAKTELIKTDASNSQELDVIQSKAMAFSMFDEFISLIIIAPTVLCFIPEYAHYVESGFNALNQAPDWYKVLILTVFCVYLGARGFFLKLIENISVLFGRKV